MRCLFDGRSGTINIFAMQDPGLIGRDNLAVMSILQTSGHELHCYFAQLFRRLVIVAGQCDHNYGLARRGDRFGKTPQDFVAKPAFF